MEIQAHKRVHCLFDKYFEHILRAGPGAGMCGVETNAPWDLLSGWITRERRGGGRWSWYTRWETLSRQSGKACRQRVKVLAIELQLLSTYDMLTSVALAPKGLDYSLVGSQNINHFL